MLRTNKQNFDFALTFIIGIFWTEKKKHLKSKDDICISKVANLVAN